MRKLLSLLVAIGIFVGMLAVLGLGYHLAVRSVEEKCPQIRRTRHAPPPSPKEHKSTELVQTSQKGSNANIDAELGELEKQMSNNARSNERCVSLNAFSFKATDVVPTLDTPIANDRNAVWCASLPAVWKHVEGTITNGPIAFAEPNATADRLNAAPDPIEDIAERDLFLAAGFVRDGIVQTIQNGMHERFPSVALPDMVNLPQESLVAYSYLNAQVKFAIPYEGEEHSLRFSPNGEDWTRVQAFGVYGEDGKDAALQARVLYYTVWEEGPVIIDCAIELDRSEYNDSIVIAFMSHKPSLADMYAEVQAKIAAAQLSPVDNTLHGEDTLGVPKIRFNLNRDYKELCNVPLGKGAIEGYHFDRISQRIRFVLDENGAELESDTIMLASLCVDDGRHFTFDRPFLLYMKKRYAERPYFVMWVENAELLQKW
ncbi:MAG: hypothetical protein JW942_04055 [Opitutales bacterium]|nr:hypothetical protein [Opitutales bacterium]